MHAPTVFLLACLVPTVAAADCKSENAKIAKLEAEVASLKKQLAAGGSQGQCSSASMFDAASMTSGMVGDVCTHLLKQTDLDDKVVSAVSGHFEAAKVMGSKVVDQIVTHPCGSGYDSCSKHITGHPIYQTHVAPHMKTLTPLAQPYVDQASVYVNPALASASKAYGDAAKTVEVKVVPTVRQTANLVSGHASTVASKVPELLHKVLDPVFVAFMAATPQHGKSLPKDPVDRFLLLCFVAFVAYNSFFVFRLAFWIAMRLFSVVSTLFIKLPLKLTAMSVSWGFFFGTGFYVCGLCRPRKSASKKVADAKAEPKKASKPATVEELSSMLQKAHEKGKLNDGVTRLVTAAKNGKPLTAPEEMKGKAVAKDVLKKALGKFKEVDIKKLGL